MPCFTCEAALLASAADLRQRDPASLSAALPSMFRKGWVAPIRNARGVPYWTVTALGESVLTLDYFARS